MLIADRFLDWRVPASTLWADKLDSGFNFCEMYSNYTHSENAFEQFDVMRGARQSTVMYFILLDVFKHQLPQKWTWATWHDHIDVFTSALNSYKFGINVKM